MDKLQEHIKRIKESTKRPKPKPGEDHHPSEFLEEHDIKKEPTPPEPAKK